jgi:hypothetical protein
MLDNSKSIIYNECIERGRGNIPQNTFLNTDMVIITLGEKQKN